MAAAHTRRRPAMQQYVKEQGDTPLCNVNMAEKGTVTHDEDQGEVHTVGEDRDTEKESDNPEHPSHAALKRDDSLSWNLSRVKQGGAIRVTTWIHGGESVRERVDEESQ